MKIETFNANLYRSTHISEVDLSKLDKGEYYATIDKAANKKFHKGSFIVSGEHIIDEILLPVEIPEQVSDEEIYKLADEYSKSKKYESQSSADICCDDYEAALKFMRDRMLPLLYKHSDNKKIQQLALERFPVREEYYEAWQKHIDINEDRREAFIEGAESVFAAIEPKEPEFELYGCDMCLQMTNHLEGVCQKCKKVELKGEEGKVGDFVKQLVTDFGKLDGQIRNYLYPILYKMFDEKKLNKGHLPDYKKASDAVTIREFNINNGKIAVSIDIHWRGDCYDQDYVII